jgi:hypothetical protein
MVSFKIAALPVSNRSEISRNESKMFAYPVVAKVSTNFSDRVKTMFSRIFGTGKAFSSFRSSSRLEIGRPSRPKSAKAATVPRISARLGNFKHLP